MHCKQRTHTTKVPQWEFRNKDTAMGLAQGSFSTWGWGSFYMGAGNTHITADDVCVLHIYFILRRMFFTGSESPLGWQPFPGRHCCQVLCWCQHYECARSDLKLCKQMLQLLITTLVWLSGPQLHVLNMWPGTMLIINTQCSLLPTD